MQTGSGRVVGGTVVGDPRHLGPKPGDGRTALPGPHPGGAVPLPITTVLYGSDEMYFRHIQDTPAASWLITHNLHQRPNVAILDTDGIEVFADVDHLDADRVAVTFPYPFAGEAICS